MSAATTEQLAGARADIESIVDEAKRYLADAVVHVADILALENVERDTFLLAYAAIERIADARLGLDVIVDDYVQVLPKPEERKAAE